MITNEVNFMDNQEELQPQEQTTGTRPAWQVWAARVGLVLFISAAPGLSTGEAEFKLAQTIAAFLGRHMES